MNKKRRKLLELGKDVLIVLLTCSALWLAAKTPMKGPLNDALGEESPQVHPEEMETVRRAEAARPLRIVANQVNSSGSGRFGVLYDDESTDALFQQVAGPLMEALSSAGEPEIVDRAQWEAALTEMPSICFDFQGELPVEVLSGWLIGDSAPIDAVVRRVVMAVQDGVVTLYYRNEMDGQYFRCLTQAADPSHLEDTLNAIADNGAFYAFEEEWCSDLDPDTLMLPEMPRDFQVYTASNPAAGGRAALEELMAGLGFAVTGSNFYTSGDEQVVRSGNDMLRLSSRGVLHYEADRDGSDRFPIAAAFRSNRTVDAVETCRQLAAATLGTRCGQARLYLVSARDDGTQLEITFGYALDGIPVWLESGHAARFIVRGGSITQFDLCLRSYEPGESVSQALPPRQAAAALKAMDLEGEEMLLVYHDGGSEPVSVGWVASDWNGGRER